MTEPAVTELRIRQAVRALLVTDADEIMLVRFEFPKGTVWSTPGGGLEPARTTSRHCTGNSSKRSA